jgi:hypothetical protein
MLGQFFETQLSLTIMTLNPRFWRPIIYITLGENKDVIEDSEEGGKQHGS